MSNFVFSMLVGLPLGLLLGYFGCMYLNKHSDQSYELETIKEDIVHLHMLVSELQAEKTDV